jgi:hypothetical protein
MDPKDQIILDLTRKLTKLEIAEMCRMPISVPCILGIMVIVWIVGAFSLAIRAKQYDEMLANQPPQDVLDNDAAELEHDDNPVPHIAENEPPAPLADNTVVLIPPHQHHHIERRTDVILKQLYSDTLKVALPVSVIWCIGVYAGRKL